MKDSSSKKLTTPDLVLLSLLAERAMHGYEANAMLEFRHVREWAGVSRPQVYYSLEKLAGLGLICEELPAINASSAEEPGSGNLDPDKRGPERHVYATTDEGREALADALERADWTEQLERPTFLTWLALSWQCWPGVAVAQFMRRRSFLNGELARRKKTLEGVLAEVGHPHHEAVWMLKLVVEQIETELNWIDQVKRELPLRSAAKNPDKPLE